ncbi:YcaO-like family protein [Micromonospora lupini]|uniref:YcaO-like family protein n=1 Tax=Micromonospora lupini TaxID=285679 RepID=UPI0033C898AF
MRLKGTHRAIDPAATWAAVEPLLGAYGITRVADVTHLDVIGIPVMLAVRPSSETLAVSQGKGATSLLARISAVMESIELWHAERPQVHEFTAAATELDLSYRIAELRPRRRWVPMETLRTTWTPAVEAGTGRTVPVPLDVVRLSYSGSHFRRPRIFSATSTGLAAGNTYAEAALHGLYECVERDLLARSGPRRHLDPATIGDPDIRALLDQLTAAGVDVAIEWLPNPYALPTFVVRLWSALFPIVCGGSGTHADAGVALSRAITEAAQTRLTEITATRDDIPSDQAPATDGCADPGFPASAGGVSYQSVLAEHDGARDDLDAELLRAADRVAEVRGRRPLLVDLSTRPDPLRVIRVVCPGLAFTAGRTLDQGGES